MRLNNLKNTLSLQICDQRETLIAYYSKYTQIKNKCVSKKKLNY